MTERINVECSSSVTAESGDYLDADTVRQWLQSVPNGATLSQIIKDLGNQRDPQPVLIGLRASWSETR